MGSADFDTTRRFVRVLGTRANDLVEFQFAIGDPDLCVELIMPRPAFDEFCAANHVSFIEPRPTPDEEPDAQRWTPHDATSHRLR